MYLHKYIRRELEIIDKTGKEVIPCVFDEIKEFGDTTDIFVVHSGGWKNGKWGIIDKDGTIRLPIEYDSVSKVENGYAIVNKGSSWSIICINVI